jgi:hypothetical protein
MSSACTSATSSGVTSQGPIGPNVSALLPLVPLPGALGLEFALRHVVDDAIAGDMLQRVGLVDILGACAADHDRRVRPPNRSCASPCGIMTSSFGPTIELVAFMNRIGSGGGFIAGLGGMVGIIEADRDDFGITADAGPEPGPPVDERQAGRIERASLARPAGDSVSPAMIRDRGPRDRGSCRRHRAMPGFSWPRGP